ncbi:MAG TPA: type VII secretion protein EccCa [Mycobacteriales bacterium]|nr:type VII secretion protein EccCa [Mycobacteriales bacterium]
MTQRMVHRPARVPPAELPLAPLEMAAPPPAGDSAGGISGAMQMILPLLGGAGSLVLIISNRNPLMLVAGGIMLGVMVIGGAAAFVAQRTGARRRAAQARAGYLAYLVEIGRDLAEDAAIQREAAATRHPTPAQLPELLRDPTRLWERRRHDPDFLVVRVGTGTDRLCRPVALAGAVRNPLSSTEPLAQAAVDRLLEHGSDLDDMPMAVPLSGSVSLVGPAGATRAVLRAMLTQLAVLHAPDDVRLGLCLGRSGSTEFDWTRWLPHVLDTDGFDGPVARRLVAGSPDELHQILGPELTRRREFLDTQRRSGAPGRITPTPRLVVVADQITAPGLSPLDLLPDDVPVEALGLTVVTVVGQRPAEPTHVDVRVTVTAEGTVTVEDLRPSPARAADETEGQIRRAVAGATTGRGDVVSGELALRIARRLAPLRLVEDSTADAPLESTIDLAGLVGVADVGDYDVGRLWAQRPLPEFLRIPFGLGVAGQRIHLDIKESAQNGMGPHGLCVGATGSGKSEVLRTLVLTLAMTHPPERLSLVLVDYKGGATFAGLEDLPHTAAMVSNLSDDTGLVDRLADAIRGEINRRQQLLLDAGSLPNTTEYNARRDAGRPLPPLPNLFVVIDEFGEMLTAKPDFIELFLQIGRIGRSIGVHLLLASQRLEEGKLRGLESYLSYRLGLRTFNAQESRAVLDVPDAFELPPIAGSGYLKVDTTVFDRFKAAYVSGTYRPANLDRAPTGLPARPMPYWLYNDTGRWLEQVPGHLGAAEVETAEQSDRFDPTTLEVVVSRLARAAEQVQQIWLPPLPAALSLDPVLGPLVADPGHGLTTADPARRGRLRLPIGLLDRPAEQWQGPCELDVSGGGGHVAIMGAPQTGKSGALRTLIAGAALTHTPADVAFYCLDLGGGGLAALAGLPHVGGVAGRLDPDRVRRTVAEVAGQLAEREQIFAEARLDSVAAMRAMQRAGRLSQIPVADIFLVIDNWVVFKEDFEDVTDIVQEIGSRGLGYGVHLIVTTGRWADLRLPMQAIMGTKLELRLNDPLDSTLGRKAVQNIGPEMHGRCVVEGGLTAQICLPRIDDRDDPTTAQDGLDDLVKQVSQAWPGNPVPEIRMLPTDVSLTSLRRVSPEAPPVLLGVDEADLRPVHLDLFGVDQHVVVFGDAESGKTNLARLIITELVNRYSDEQVVFAIFDLRRTLLDVVPEPYLGGYAGTPPVAAGLAAGLAGQELTRRMPPDDVTSAQLRERSWWKGPEIIVLADDYDLLSPGGPGPLAPLLEYLPQSRDLGLHIVLLRHSGGASRAIHEPVVQRLKENGATGLLLSGDRQEGQLWPGAYLSIQPPGRGLLIRRGRRPLRLQLAHVPRG